MRKIKIWRRGPVRMVGPGSEGPTYVISGRWHQVYYAQSGEWSTPIPNFCDVPDMFPARGGTWEEVSIRHGPRIFGLLAWWIKRLEDRINFRPLSWLIRPRKEGNWRASEPSDFYVRNALRAIRGEEQEEDPIVERARRAHQEFEQESHHERPG